MLAGVCGCVFVVSGFGVVVGSWALNTQTLPIANEKLSIINNKLFLTIVLSSPCSFMRTSLPAAQWLLISGVLG